MPAFTRAPIWAAVVSPSSRIAAAIVSWLTEKQEQTILAAVPPRLPVPASSAMRSIGAISLPSRDLACSTPGKSAPGGPKKMQAAS